MLYGLYVTLISGVTYGLVISLLAVGLSLIFGVMGTVNIAHGSFYMMGGFLFFVGSSLLLLPVAMAFVFTLIASFVFGVIVLLLLIPRRIRVTNDPQEGNKVMMIFLGFATIAEYVVFLLFGGQTLSVPSLLNGVMAIPGGIYVRNQELLAALISLAFYAFLLLTLKYTKIGMGIRAYSQNKEIADALGIDGARLALIVFGIGAMMAAAAGSLLASVYSIDSTSGWNELITAFIIVIFGGIGSVPGSLIGGLLYGIIYSFFLYYYPSYAFAAVLLMIYFIIIFRPSGLLGEHVERT